MSPRRRCEITHLAHARGYIKRRSWAFCTKKRDVAQLVARTAGGGEVAGSSPVIPTRLTLPVLKNLFIREIHETTYCSTGASPQK